MSNSTEKANKFRALHNQASPLILYNIWDGGSAKAVESAGAKALATGSAPVALSKGMADGQQIPLDAVLQNIQQIVNATDLPVSLDFEGGYTTDNNELKDNVTRVLETGVVGFNFEDQIVGSSDIHDVAVQAARVAAFKQAIDSHGNGAFLNARTDLFLKTPSSDHSPALLEEAINRAKAYEQAGADGIFAPGLVNLEYITKLCSAVEIPINIIPLPGCPSTPELAQAGVRRVSYGPLAYKRLMSDLAEQAKQAFNF